MAQFEILKDSIKRVIKQNGNEEITGNLLQQTLIAIVNTVGNGYVFKGVAVPDGQPGTPDNNVFYIALTPGVYPAFGGFELSENDIALLSWNGHWTLNVVNTPTMAAVGRVTVELAQLAADVTKRVLSAENDALIVDSEIAAAVDISSYGVIVVKNGGRILPTTGAGKWLYQSGAQWRIVNAGAIDDFVIDETTKWSDLLAYLDANSNAVADMGGVVDLLTDQNIYGRKEFDEIVVAFTKVYDEQGRTLTQLLADKAGVSDVEEILALIPAQATAQNQLADKAFVNSSIATNTANFIGTFNSLEELEQYPKAGLTNNDYAFVIDADYEGNRIFSRYKWNGEAWLFEYELNNSSFTAEQWAAINSGITNGDVIAMRAAVELLNAVVPADASAANPLVTKGYIEDRHVVLPLLTLDATQEQLQNVYNAIQGAPANSAFFISLPENRGIMPLATSHDANQVFAQYADGRFSHELKIVNENGAYTFTKVDRAFATSADLQNYQPKLSEQQLQNIANVPGKADKIAFVKDLESTTKTLEAVANTNYALGVLTNFNLTFGAGIDDAIIDIMFTVGADAVISIDSAAKVVDKPDFVEDAIVEINAKYYNGQWVVLFAQVEPNE